MSRTNQATQLGAFVRTNTPLRALYILGTVAVIVGLIMSLFATTAPWLFIGNGLAGFGGFALVGAMVAHAINWQIVNR